MSTELTLVDVARHNSRDDNYIVLWNKVYNVTSFLEEHPGGDQVLVEVAGQDATEAFEEVGHTKESHNILEELFVGTLKRLPGDTSMDKERDHSRKKALAVAQAVTTDDGINESTSPVAAIMAVLGVIIAYWAYRYSHTKEQPVL